MDDFLYGPSHWGMEVLRPRWSSHAAKCLGVSPEHVSKELVNIYTEEDGSEVEGLITEARDNLVTQPPWLVVSASDLKLGGNEKEQRKALWIYIRSMYGQ